MRTSTSHPLQIAEVQPYAGAGKIGITFCPGKVQPSAMSGSWDRDLGLDLDAVAAWNAASVVTLVEDHELQTLQVTDMGPEVQAKHMRWHQSSEVLRARLEPYTGAIGPIMAGSWRGKGSYFSMCIDD
jgi:hypothetical protein